MNPPPEPSRVDVAPHAAAVPPPLPDTTPPDQSEVTRLLSIGAETDRAFGDEVIGELVGNHHRFAAPAYGYDASTVLGHALAARERRRAKTVVIGIFALQWFVLGVMLVAAGDLGPWAFWVTAVIGVWGVWASHLLDRILERQIVTVHLRRGGPGSPHAFTGAAPVVAPGSAGLYAKIREEQDSSAGVVYYGGYVPFVGAGNAVRQWSFACLLERATPSALSGEDRSDRPRHEDPDPFDAEQLTEYMEERLRTSLLTEVAAHSQRLRGLEVTRRFYSKAVGRTPPIAAERIEEYKRAANDVPDHYDAAREYLCVRVGSWSQELVTSVFLNVDLKGRMLYTQFHGYHLLPIKSAFHEADRQSRLTSSEVWDLAGGAVLDSLLGVLRAVVWPFEGLNALRDRRNAMKLARRKNEEDLGHIDWGARRSVREMGAGGFRHFFQQMDDEKFIKIIERRTFEVILDFLEDHHVDTTEYRAQQNALLNVGILQTGSGTIVNSGATAVGPQAEASGSG